jgi:hypothetical protein
MRFPLILMDRNPGFGPCFLCYQMATLATEGYDARAEAHVPTRRHSVTVLPRASIVSDPRRGRGRPIGEPSLIRTAEREVCRGPDMRARAWVSN